MAVNQQNVSVVTQFNKAPARFFTGDAGVAPGATSFIAACLCRVFPGASGALCGNYDSGTGQGWFISVTDLGDTGLQIRGFIGEGGVAEDVLVVVGPQALGKLLLIHLGITSGEDEARLYFNGGLIGTITLANPLVPSVLGVGVGCEGSDGLSPAVNCDIAGVAYSELAYTATAMNALVAAHFDACYRSHNMSFGGQTAPGPSAWLHRWDAREGVVLAGAQGVYNAAAGALVQFPATRATWAPSDGVAALTRQGPAPTVAAPLGGVAANVITNPVWATTPAIVGATILDLAQSLQLPFVNADLNAGVLTVVHNFGSDPVSVTVRNDALAEVAPDAVTFPDNNTVAIDLSSFGAIAGTWRVLVVGD